MAYVRSYAPKWYFNDYTGAPLNDEYFAFFLSNVFPYAIQVPAMDPQALTFWTGGIVQFDTSGALPDNLYLDDTLVYRIEIRHGNTQADPLIWVINNYVPNSETPTPLAFTALSTNQFSNPEFVEQSSVGVTTNTPGSPGTYTYNVAPDWDIVATGNGTVAFSFIVNEGSDNVITNPAYILDVVTSGAWTNVILRQRFYGNGALFRATTAQNSALAGVFVARMATGSFTTSMQYIDSAGNQFAIIESAEMTTSYAQFSDAQNVPDLPQSTDPSTSGYVDIFITLPNIGEVELSSFQLIKQITPVPLDYIQETPSRQIDHLFHYYKNSIIMQPKESLLTGMNFSLNPWQYTATMSATVASQCVVSADQIIIYQQNGASQVAVGENTPSNNYAYTVTAVTNTNQFALIEYIDPLTIAPYWGNTLSALVTASIATVNSTEIQFKVRLIYSAVLPSATGTTYPIASWGSVDPTFASDFTAIAPINDPVYTISSASEMQFAFNDFQLPASTAATMTLGIVIYTLNDMSTTTTADSLLFYRTSLAVNEFAIDSNVLTFDQNLSRCQYYFESSYPIGTIPGATGPASFLYIPSTFVAATGSCAISGVCGFNIIYANNKRALPATTIYSNAGTVANVSAFSIATGPLTHLGNVAISGNYVSDFSSTKNTSYQLINYNTLFTQSNGGQAFQRGELVYNYAANARLGG